MDLDFKILNKGLPFVFWRWSWVFRSKCLSSFKSNFYREGRKTITTTYNDKCNDLVVRSSDYKGTIERPFLQHFGLFLGTVRQVLNRCLFLATLGTRGFSRVRREVSMLAEGRHVFGHRPKPREKLFARITIKTWQKPETVLEKSLAPRVSKVW